MDPAAPGRLIGLETEYAVRYSGNGPAPGNDRVYEALIEAVSSRVATRAGDGAPAKNQVFLENGGAFYYEHLPHRPDGGLIEGATPECRSVAELLVYQKAQERLLLEALPGARERLSHRGFAGEIGLLKNCRDGFDHVYGAQENYEADVARGAGLVAWWLGVALLLPLIAVQSMVGLVVQFVVGLLLVLGLLLVTALGLFAVLISARLGNLPFFAALVEADERALAIIVGRVQLWMAYVLMTPVTLPMSLFLRAVAFRRIRRQALAFLISRPIVSGTGTVSLDGRFGLSEKGPAVRRLIRASISPNDRPIFDTGNLLKLATLPMSFRFIPTLGLFNRRQRLQLSLSDSNGVETAEFLKVATTALVLDMVEAGALGDAPRLRRPLVALQTLIADPTLAARVELVGGGEMSALELQRFYLERARQFLRRRSTVALEQKQAVELWAEVLGSLERADFGALVGRLDWVTKRYLIEAASARKPPAVDRGEFLKTLDLRYHELGQGYWSRLDHNGLVPRLVSPEAVERAMVEPPAEGPAWQRGAFVRRHAGSPLPIRVSWTSAWIGGRLQGKLIRFRTPGR